MADNNAADVGHVPNAVLAEEPVGNRTIAKLVPFRGNGKDSMTAESWALSVDRAARIMTWSDATTAEAALDAFREEANIWRENRAGGSPDAQATLGQWSTLKPIFLERFKKIATTGQLVNLMDTLRQKSGEGAKAFADRVENAIMRANADALEATPAAGKAGFRSCMSRMQAMHFANGLRGELKFHVDMQVQEGMDLQAVMELAVKAESARPIPGGNVLHAIDAGGMGSGGQATAAGEGGGRRAIHRGKPIPGATQVANISAEQKAECLQPAAPWRRRRSRRPRWRPRRRRWRRSRRLSAAEPRRIPRRGRRQPRRRPNMDAAAADP